MLCSFFGSVLVLYFLRWGFSWVASYVLPWLCVILLSFLLAKTIRYLVKGHYKKWLPVVVFLLPLLIHFSLNPVYEGDFNKMGQRKSLVNNQILSDVLKFDSNFEGMVCVASGNCPYCIEAIKDKVNLVYERGKVNALVYLGAGNEELLRVFRVNTDAPNIPIVINSNFDGVIDIDENAIPVFLYIKNKKITHLWRNEQLGFPALDWIENKTL